MSRSKYLFTTVVLIISIACTKTKTNDIYRNLKPSNISLITNDSFLVSTFIHAKLLSDSMVVTMFETDSILKNLLVHYGFEYDNWEKNEQDSLLGLPKKFIFTYYLKCKGDTIPYGGYIVIDSLCNIRSCDYSSFIGLREAYRDKWKIQTPTAAKCFAMNNGFENKRTYIYMRSKYIPHLVKCRPEEVYNFSSFIEYWSLLKDDRYNYLWVVKNDSCNGSAFWIDAKDSTLMMRTKVKCKF